MGVVSELVVSCGVEGTQAVVDALKKIDGAQVQLKDSTATSTKGMKMSWSDFTTGLNQGLQLAKTALDGINMAMGVVNDYSVYNLSMEKGSIATGMMVDEYSRLVQAADDAYVTQDKFTTAMEMATKNGYPITIDSLGIIADKLNGIQNPSEKAKLAMDIFGRGWAEIMPFLDRGSAGINALTGNINSNMIATDASVAKTKRFATAVDDFNDASTGAKNEIGSAVMPVLTKTLNDFTTYADLKSKVNDLVKAGTIDQKEYTKALWASKPAEALLGLYNANIQEYTQSLSKATTAGNDLWQTLFDSSDSWDVFSDGAKRAGLDLGMITEEFYNSEKAAVAIQNATDSAFADITKAAEQATAIAAVTTEYEKLAETLNVQLAQANVNVSVQMTTFREGVAGELVTGLKDAGFAGDELVSRLKLIDQYAGTDYTIQYQMKMDMPELLKTLIEHPDQFLTAAQGFEDAFAPLTASVGEAMGAVGELEAQLAALEKTYTITITTILNDGAIKNYIPPDKFAHVNYTPHMSTANMDLGVGAPTKAIGGPVYPGNAYNWQEPGREGELLIPSQYGRVASSTEVAQMLRGAMRPGDGASAGQQTQVVNNNHTEVIVQATISNDYDVDKLTREIVRRINA